MFHLITGLPGSGKSTVANLISEMLEGTVITSDELFDLLYPNEYGTVKFSEDTLDTIYRSIRPISFYLHKTNPRGNHILEGSFRFEKQRNFTLDIFSKFRIPYKVIYVYLSKEEVLKSRTQHDSGFGSVTDIYNEYIKVRDVYQKPENAFEIDNSGSFEDLVKLCKDYVEKLE